MDALFETQMFNRGLTAVQTWNVCINMSSFPHAPLQLYGYCYQDSNDISDTLTTITELGSPLEMIQLLQTSWEDRFRVSTVIKSEL